LNKTYFSNRGTPLSYLNFVKILIFLLSGSIILFASIHTAYGEWVPFASITLEQLYDSNIFLDPDDFHRPEANKSDFRTNIMPSVGLRYQTPIQTISAEYALNYSVFVNNSDQNYLGHTGNFNFERQISEHLKWYLHDSLSVSEEPRTNSYDYITLNYGRRRNLTNNGVTGVEYYFGAQDFVKIRYSDSRLDYLKDYHVMNGSSSRFGSDDSVTYGPGLDIEYWINVQHGFVFTYDWERSDYKIRQSERRDHMDLGYNYRLSPHTSVRCDFILDYVDSKDPLLFDYKIYQGTVGIAKEFNEKLSLDIYGGFYYRPSGDIPDTFDSSDNEGFSGGISVTYNQENWNVSVQGDAGARIEYGDYNNRGYTPYRSFSIDFNYLLTPRINYYVLLSYDYEKSPDFFMETSQGEYRQETYDLSTGFKYKILPWLHSTVEYEYSEESASRVIHYGGTQGGYKDHRGLISLTADFERL